MNDARAIAAQLVDLRNVGTHKVVKLTVHVPEEQALKLTELFGWPTMVNPVPVAIARLIDEKGGDAHRDRSPTHNTAPRPSVPAGGDRKKWEDYKPSQQAYLLCRDPSFWRFLRELCPGRECQTEEQAAAYVRRHCGVSTRAHIIEGDKSNDYWLTLVDEYRIWQNEVRYVA